MIGETGERKSAVATPDGKSRKKKKKVSGRNVRSSSTRAKCGRDHTSECAPHDSDVARGGGGTGPSPQLLVNFFSLRGRSQLSTFMKAYTAYAF